MEKWRLDHPEMGRIELLIGFSYEFKELFGDWPYSVDGEGRIPPADAGIKERFLAQFKNPTLFMQALVDGQRVAKPLPVGNRRIPLRGTKLDRDKPHLKVEKNGFDEVIDVDYREGSRVVEFTPPPGSRAEKRKQAMESSEFKRTFIPILTGLGKGGWALAVLVLGPLVSRLIDWLLSFLPDWELPAMPQVHLPVPAWHLPAPPEVYLPVPGWHLPSFNLPNPPEWLLFILEYTKIWVPIVMGIVFGVMALRRHRKSEAEKERWTEERGPEERRSREQSAEDRSPSEDRPDALR